MGIYLATPNTSKESQDVNEKKIICGCSSMQGWRSSQEDAHNMIPNYYNNISLFGVYDGHGGLEVSKYVAEHFPCYLKTFMEKHNNMSIEDMLKEAFLTFDSKLKEDETIVELKKIMEADCDQEDEKLRDASTEEEGSEDKINNVLNGVSKKKSNYRHISPLISKKKRPIESSGNNDMSEMDFKPPDCELIDSPDSLNNNKNRDGGGITKHVTKVDCNKQHNVLNHIISAESEICTSVSSFDCEHPTSSSSSANFQGKNTESWCEEMSIEEHEASILRAEAQIPIEELKSKYGDPIATINTSILPGSEACSSSPMSKDDRVKEDSVEGKSDHQNTHDAENDKKQQPSTTNINRINNTNSTATRPFVPLISEHTKALLEQYTKEDKAFVAKPKASTVHLNDHKHSKEFVDDDDDQDFQADESATSTDGEDGSSIEEHEEESENEENDLENLESGAPISCNEKQHMTCTTTELTKSKLDREVSILRKKGMSSKCTKIEDSSRGSGIKRKKLKSAHKVKNDDSKITSSSCTLEKSHKSAGDSVTVKKVKLENTEDIKANGDINLPHHENGILSDEDVEIKEEISMDHEAEIKLEDSVKNGDLQNEQDSSTGEEEEEAESEEDGEEEIEENSEDEDDDDDDDDYMTAQDMLSMNEGSSNVLHNLLEKQKPGYDSGCTAVLALLKGRELYVANIGDSRCVLSLEGKAVDMSIDHKPEDPPERDRIVKAGGVVTEDGRVNEGLNLSRAFGDHNYKEEAKLSDTEQMIIALPDVTHATITDKHDFLILACDGIWNSMTSQEVVDFVIQRKEKYLHTPSKICEEIFEHCLAPNTGGDGTGCDNMTCVLIFFKPEMFIDQNVDNNNVNHLNTDISSN